ncbi:hypothetical protein [Streptomyces asiaticus]|uniref:hypothetical protein n=1 Tax=Streptomyces asiaticus TaxID=114695 RepID=UPI0037F3A9C1
MDALVTRLPYRDEDLLRILRNQVRFLLTTGAPYDHPLDAMLATVAPARTAGRPAKAPSTMSPTA